jgi:glycine/D-amino acid oxidase-like deaminating enzyme
MKLSPSIDLRGGTSCWCADDDMETLTDPWPEQAVDIAIIGSGINGASIAERLVEQGRGVALFDRRPPAHGSTAASTALVMWAADVPLTELTQSLGEAEANRRWRRMHLAVQTLAQRVEALGLDCGWVSRPELYLAGNRLDEQALRGEGDLRRRAGLPATFMTAQEVGARFAIKPRPALLCDGSFEVDPVRLTLALLKRARTPGATITAADIVDLKKEGEGLRLTDAEGRTVLAREVVLATGYETARTWLPTAFELGSSFAIASPPKTAPLWNENALIWEASDPYLYARATRDGRVIFGGEDEDAADPRKRDRMIEAKAATLVQKAAALVADPVGEIDCAWSATFGSSPDGLPAIGRAKGQERLWLAAGFGGNGVTFAMLAADLIGAAFAGTPDPDAVCFDPYRFG